MLIESFNKVSSRPTIDKANHRLNNVVVMTTTHNESNKKVTPHNAEQIVKLGNEVKPASYLGHAKKGITSNDRLPWRLGALENFRLDGDRVLADFNISPTVSKNPVLPSNMEDYLYALAENEPDKCGFSMSVGYELTDSDEMDIQNLLSVDLVEHPALVPALFSKDSNNEEIGKMKQSEFASEQLTSTIDILNLLDEAIKYKQPTADLVAQLVATAQTIKVDAPAPVEAPVEEAKTEAVEAPKVEAEAVVEVPAPVVEAPAVVDAPAPVEEVKAFSVEEEISNLKSLVTELKSLFVAQFSKPESELKETVIEPKKQVVFSVNAPIPHESSNVGNFSKDQHREEYHRLRKENPSEAAKYFEEHLK